MKLLRSSVLALMLGAALPAVPTMPAQAQVAVDVSVEVAPPPLPYYEQPVIPADGYIWVPGYWSWDPTVGDYYWVPGTWVEPPQPELLWTPAYWGWDNGRYRFYPGYWGREVGFYGGIDYGYGYTGDGYYGGRWDHGAFFYNRTVNNIVNVRITNVFERTVVVNNNVSRVSFNGGNGGIMVRPTAAQETFAHERHVEATPMQRQHVELAAKDRSLFSKENHGEPAIAATSRPGVMQGEGVTRASRTPVGPGAQSGREPPRPGQEAPRVNEPGREPPRAEEKAAPVEQPRREPQEVPKEAPKAEPRPAEMNREPPRNEPRNEPRAEPRPAPEPRVEERRPEERPAAPPPPRVEERRPGPPPEAARPAAPPPHAAPPPRPAPAAHPPAREEEKR
jgi:hypothetical protein